MSKDNDGPDFLKAEELGVSGIKAATINAMITNTAPKANGGPGTRF